jgi:integrase
LVSCKAVVHTASVCQTHTITTTMATSVPAKEVIEGSFHSQSTLKTYKTYQKQFIAYCQQHKAGLDVDAATTTDCTDFFHHLYSLGRKARTIDSAKTALVAYYNEKGIEPNPARDPSAKRYVVGLQKYNKINNIDEENKAYPVSVFYLSTIMNSLSSYHLFMGSLYRVLFSGCFLGCFRISEMLNLTWDDVSLMKDDKGQYLSVRLRWHKKASVDMDCQVYHLVDELSFPCLKICVFFQDYLEILKKGSPNLSERAYVFPSFAFTTDGLMKVNWYKKLEQNQVRTTLLEIVQRNSNLSTGITLHSMRRGGAFYRVFESRERRFNFRELMAWWMQRLAVST